MTMENFEKLPRNAEGRPPTDPTPEEMAIYRKVAARIRMRKLRAERALEKAVKAELARRAKPTTPAPAPKSKRGPGRPKGGSKKQAIQAQITNLIAQGRLDVPRVKDALQEFGVMRPSDLPKAKLDAFRDHLNELATKKGSK
jgi:hypothetical protein